MCGATSAQKNQQASTQAAYNTATQNAASIFSNSQNTFSDLMSSFAPTVAAGPSQNGFSGQTLSNLNSSAITQTGQEAKNAKVALGNADAATSPTADLPSGGSIGGNLSIAENAGNQTASELSNIQQADEAQGNANYNNAVKGLAGATGVFDPANSATGAATNAGNTANTATNNVAQSAASPWQLAAGAVGSIAGAALNPAGAIGGSVNSGLSSLGGAVSGGLKSLFGGGGNTNAGPYGANSD
jgi:hypothetical protein